MCETPGHAVPTMCAVCLSAPSPAGMSASLQVPAPASASTHVMHAMMTMLHMSRRPRGDIRMALVPHNSFGFHPEEENVGPFAVGRLQPMLLPCGNDSQGPLPQI